MPNIFTQLAFGPSPFIIFGSIIGGFFLIVLSLVLAGIIIAKRRQKLHERTEREGYTVTGVFVTAIPVYGTARAGRTHVQSHLPRGFRIRLLYKDHFGTEHTQDTMKMYDQFTVSVLERIQAFPVRQLDGKVVIPQSTIDQLTAQNMEDKRKLL